MNLDEITVKDPELMAGENVTFHVSIWAETETSFRALIQRFENGKSWARGEWFPKNKCTYTRTDPQFNHGLMTAPKRLLERKQIINLITKVAE